MKKHELLVPAGNMECLYQAVYHGADAVYIAGQSFGARKFASNFTNDELVKAIKFCHLYGVKVFVTMNTLIKDSEVDDYLEQIRFLHKNNVDAVIVQDFGMICLLRDMFPNLEIHASTQANNSSYDICKLFYEMGVKRVVFSRELSVTEIDNIDVPIEKEAFIHGALCVSYSGCCLMSSMLGGRSGNRGECAGSCRLPYTLMCGDEVIETSKYLLSMKELNTSTQFDRLLNSSIYSFKIEGRMKGPLYVGFITSLYRRLIDGDPVDISVEIEKLKTIFNREFTLGHMFGVNDSDNINRKSPNHVGLRIGHVTVWGDKIKIELDKGRSLHQNDAIRFLNSNKGMIVNFLYDKNMNLCSSSDNICYVDNKVELDSNDILTKTQDSLLEKEYILESVYKRIPVSFFVNAHVNDELKISISDGENVFSVSGGFVQEAINSPTSQSDIVRQLSKLGNTPFVCSDVNFDISDNIFIQVKVLNEMRRELVNKLISSRESKVRNEYIERNVSFEKFNDALENSLTCSVFNNEQLERCINLGFDRIYVNSKDLYEKYSSYENVYFVLDRCALSYDDVPNKYITSDIFNFRGDAVGNYSINVTNIYTAYYLRKLGLRVVGLSSELNEYEMKLLIDNFNLKFGFVNFELLAFGRVENMIIKGNILDIDKNNYKYKLIDFKNREFPVFFDGVNTHVYNCECRLLNDKVTGVSARMDFFDENYLEIEHIMEQFK